MKRFERACSKVIVRENREKSVEVAGADRLLEPAADGM